MKSKWIIVWHFGKNEDNDVCVEGVFNNRAEAEEYLKKCRNGFGNGVVFSILAIPYEKR